MKRKTRTQHVSSVSAYLEDIMVHLSHEVFITAGCFPCCHILRADKSDVGGLVIDLWYIDLMRCQVYHIFSDIKCNIDRSTISTESSISDKTAVG